MDRSIKTIFWTIAVFFLIVFSFLVYRQAFSAALTLHPGNHRELLAEYSVNRGSIFSDDGKIIAESIAVKDVYKREYPFKETAAGISGYWDPVRGRTGIEESFNSWLTDDKTFTDLEDWFSSLVNQKKRGNDITLTIDSELQQVAWEALGDNKGAVVALDPVSGAVKALVSKPSYDPNNIDDHWEKIANDENSPLLNRATLGKYTPGSIFKVVTAAGALSRKIVEPSTTFNSPAEFDVDGGKVRNFEGTKGGRLTVAKAFAASANTVFGQIGLEMGADNLVAAAIDFGFNRPIEFDLPVAASSIPPPNEMDKVMVAWSAVGQGETLVSPLHMSLIAAAIANGGKMPKPYLVKDIRNFKGEIVRKSTPSIMTTAIDEKTANEIKKMMIAVVEEGTAKRIWTPNVEIAGKTGSAEVNKDDPAHAWFIGFAPADDPKIAVAVIVEKKGLGGRVAAPIAKEVISEAVN